jgi:hypothetical protein
MATQNIKDQARELIDRLPDLAAWDDLMTDVREIRRQFGLPQ